MFPAVFAVKRVAVLSVQVGFFGTTRSWVVFENLVFECTMGSSYRGSRIAGTCNVCREFSTSG